MTIYYKTAHQLRKLLQSRELSFEELIQNQFQRIDKIESQVKAYITLTKEKALKKARELDRKICSDTTSNSGMGLQGIPVALKDNIITKGVKTTCASKMLKDHVPPYNATVVECLEYAGAIIIGKNNMDEFAMGSSTGNSAFYPTRNPWDLKRVPGGSSGGTAAAVAAGEAVIGLGSDTGGSVRQPAAFCGIVGFKPTYGSVSRFGLVAFASSLDQIGPLTRDVTDCALVMNHLAGYDDKDSTSVNIEKNDFTRALVSDVKGVKVGVPGEYFAQPIEPEITEKVKKCIQLLVQLGAEADEVSLPHTELALPTYYILAPAEASSNLNRYDGVRIGWREKETVDINEMYYTTRTRGFGNEVKRRIILGTYVLSAGYYDQYYLKAQKVRTLIKEDFKKVFQEYDVLITPTTPTTAFKLNQNSKPLEMYKNDIFTIPANLAGIPAISIPIGFDSRGLPIGLQIMGNYFTETVIFRIAYTLEQELGVKERNPVI